MPLQKQKTVTYQRNTMEKTRNKLILKTAVLTILRNVIFNQQHRSYFQLAEKTI